MDTNIPIIKNLRPVTVTATKLTKSSTNSSPLRPFQAKNYDIKFRASPQILSLKEYSSVNASPFKDTLLATSNYRSNSPRQFIITSPKGHRTKSPRENPIETPLSSRLRMPPEREAQKNPSVSISGEKQSPLKDRENKRGHMRSSSYGMTPNVFPNVFATKVLPMMDSRGKLNVKFFLKSNHIRSPINSLSEFTQTMRSPQAHTLNNSSTKNLKGQYSSQNSQQAVNPFVLRNSLPTTILSRREDHTKSLPKGMGVLVIPQKSEETSGSHNELKEPQEQDEIIEEMPSKKIDWEELFLQFEEKVTNQLIGSGRSGYTTSKAGNPLMNMETRRSSILLNAENEGYNEPLYLHEAMKISTIQQKERDSSIKKKGRLWVPKELRKTGSDAKDYLRERRHVREDREALGIDTSGKGERLLDGRIRVLVRLILRWKPLGILRLITRRS